MNEKLIKYYTEKKGMLEYGYICLCQEELKIYKEKWCELIYTSLFIVAISFVISAMTMDSWIGRNKKYHQLCKQYISFLQSNTFKLNLFKTLNLYLYYSAYQVSFESQSNLEFGRDI